LRQSWQRLSLVEIITLGIFISIRAIQHISFPIGVICADFIESAVAARLSILVGGDGAPPAQEIGNSGNAASSSKWFSNISYMFP